MSLGGTEKKDFRIVRIGELEADLKTDDFFSLRSKVMASESMYPGIESWLDNKVVNGLKTGERIGYLGLLGNQPVISAVVKRANNSKFCHLKIDESLQDRGFGEIFFALMAFEVRNKAS